MIRRTALITALAMIPMGALAQDELLTLEVLGPIIIKYAEAIGCVGSVGDKNVARFDVYGAGNPAPATYVAIADTDIGCYGGNGTSAGRLVVLETQPWRGSHATYVLPELSEPNAFATGTPRFITSLYVKGGQLHATSVEYGPNDNQCCPSIRNIYKVDLTKEPVFPVCLG